jgi:hypothetical protein
MVSRKQEVNKLILKKIDSSTETKNMKEFLERILEFEREFFHGEGDKSFSNVYDKELKHALGERFSE